MRNLRRLLLLALFLLPASLAAVACGGGGEPEAKGEPAKQEAAPSGEVREVRLTARDFVINPSTVELTVGERVRLVYVNEGEVDHDIELEDFIAEDVSLIQGPEEAEEAAGEPQATEGTHMEEDEMAEMMEKAAEGLVHPHAPPGGTVIMEFTPTESGTYTITCPMEGHADKGMTGTLVVRP